MILDFSQCFVVCVRTCLWQCGCPCRCVCCCVCGQSVALPPAPSNQREDRARTERRPAGKWNVHKLMLRWRNVGKARVPWPLPPYHHPGQSTKPPIQATQPPQIWHIVCQGVQICQTCFGATAGWCLSTGADWKCHTFWGTDKRPGAALPTGDALHLTAGRN